MARGKRTSARARRRSASGGISANTKAFIILSVALVLLGGLLFGYMDALTKAGDINEHSCRINDMPEITVVVIDHTDRIGPVQKAALEKRLQRVAGSVQKNGALKFFSVNSTRDQILIPDLDLCNPGNPRDVNEWTENSKFVKNDYEKKFSSVLDESLKSILNAKVAQQSPIMEAVQSAVVTSFLGKENDTHIKKLYLASDLLEHTANFSLYEAKPDFSTFENGAQWPAVKSDMKDVKVEILYLHRAGAESLQTPQLKTFWQMYFIRQGAVSVTFTPIEG